MKDSIVQIAKFTKSAGLENIELSLVLDVLDEVYQANYELNPKPFKEWLEGLLNNYPTNLKNVWEDMYSFYLNM